MKHALRLLVDLQDLSTAEAGVVMSTIMRGEATPAQIAAFAVAMRMKGETAEEIAGFAQVMRDYAVHVPVSTDKVLVDTCGTGGDSLKTFNISTAAAIVVASDGRVAVAKHGNRAATSKCGSADVLEALGVKLDLSPMLIGECIESVGIGFLFASAMHPALRYASAPRSEIGVRTFFNILGPLTNPAGAKVQLIGVFDRSLCPMLAAVLGKLGSERAMMVHGDNGLDEISTLGTTSISELKNGQVSSYVLDAEHDLGIRRANISELAAGETPQANAEILLSIVDGDDSGPRKDIVCLNAAGVLVAAGVVPDLESGFVRANELIADGYAAETLRKLRAFAD
jgi:anthranilate phosphoribosyltransferase